VLTDRELTVQDAADAFSAHVTAARAGVGRVRTRCAGRQSAYWRRQRPRRPRWCRARESSSADCARRDISEVRCQASARTALSAAGTAGSSQARVRGAVAGEAVDARLGPAVGAGLGSDERRLPNTRDGVSAPAWLRRRPERAAEGTARRGQRGDTESGDRSIAHAAQYVPAPRTPARCPRLSPALRWAARPRPCPRC
jgi:hypothetical protein